MGEVVDGEYQKYAVESGTYVRRHFWGAYPALIEMVRHLSEPPGTAGRRWTPAGPRT
jgi:pyruvate dehydrogenase E1 component